MAIVLFEELFPYEHFKVECECYKLFKDDKDIRYLGVPWNQILNSHWLKIPNIKSKSFYISALKELIVPGTDYFTVCQNDLYLEFSQIYKQLNIKTIFCPLQSENDHIDGIQIKPISFISPLVFSNRKKNILVSFVGCHQTHEIRRTMPQRFFGKFFIYRNEYHIDSNYLFFINSFEMTKREKEYSEILERSTFALCPRGSSPSSVRFWECLKCGTIPILVSDQWVLPEWNWGDTIIRIKENDFQKIDLRTLIEMLKKIPEIKVEEMKKNCLQADNVFGKKNLKNYILKNIS